MAAGDEGVAVRRKGQGVNIALGGHQRPPFLAGQGARFDLKNKQGRTPSELARGKTAALMNKLAGGASTQQ